MSVDQLDSDAVITDGEILATQFAVLPEVVLFHPNLSGNAVRLFAMMQFRAGRKGYAWPSHKRLADDLNISQATVKRLINELKKAGFVKAIPRFRDDGSQTSNAYRMNMDPITDEGSPIHQCTPCPPSPVSHLEPEKLEPEKENQSCADSPFELSQEQLTEVPSTDESQLFEEIWREYPKKIRKTEALKAFRARLREGVSVETLRACVRHYAAKVKADGTEARYVMHGATFFGPNQRWLEYTQPVENAGENLGKQTESQEAMFERLRAEAREQDRREARGSHDSRRGD